MAPGTDMLVSLGHWPSMLTLKHPAEWITLLTTRGSGQDGARAVAVGKERTNRDQACGILFDFWGAVLGIDF